MTAPILNNAKCSIAIAEYATGHLHNLDFTLYINNETKENVFKTFESLQEAELYALNMVNKNPKFECIIFDQNGKYLKTYDLNGLRL